MGLDMYMSKKTYVKQWSHNKPEDQFDVDVKKGGEPFTPIKKERISEVVEEVGYWRKFNALHNWFVNECGDGEDNCQEIYIGDKLPELLETLQKVKEVYDSNPPDKEEQLDDIFPTSSGFFFGGTEYDEYYIQEVNETINLLTELLKEDENGDYYYQASW
jgi:hypothetical protein